MKQYGSKNYSNMWVDSCPDYTLEFYGIKIRLKSELMKIMGKLYINSLNVKILSKLIFFRKFPHFAIFLLGAGSLNMKF